ncbi:MAG TPA: hypothetical protein VFN92_13365 [Solirubrobacterales bacterium]|nr:hypothetical protein [Solirubrobacterales bacterium]
MSDGGGDESWSADCPVAGCSAAIAKWNTEGPPLPSGLKLTAVGRARGYVAICADGHRNPAAALAFRDGRLCFRSPQG